MNPAPTSTALLTEEAATLMLQQNKDNEKEDVSLKLPGLKIQGCINGKITKIYHTHKICRKKELREFMPSMFCSDGKHLECPSGTKEWQKLDANKGLRCDSQLKMCDGSTISCSGSSPDKEYFVQCPKPNENYVLNCFNQKIDNVLYESSNIVGIQCGNEYRFCNGNSEFGGESGSFPDSGSSGSGSGCSGSGCSGSTSGSNTYSEYEDPEGKLL